MQCTLIAATPRTLRYVFVCFVDFGLRLALDFAIATNLINYFCANNTFHSLVVLTQK